MANRQVSSEGIEVFVSYSHRDEPLWDELEKHLGILKRQKLILTWFDRKICAGEEWKGQIDEHLDSGQDLISHQSIPKAIISLRKRLIYG